mgnify:CR=1 FL=1
MVKILAPGDRSPNPNRLQDYLDYRGVARERELRNLFSGQVSVGCYLHPRGKLGRELFLPENLLYQHCAVIGRSGAGKTEGIVVPWISALLQNGFSVVTIDVKGDLLDRLSPVIRKTRCRSWYWDADNPGKSLSWNWLNELQPDDDSDIEAAVTSILGKPNPNDTQPFFYQRDVRWLRTLISVVKEVYGNRATSSDLYELVADRSALQDVFRKYPHIRSFAVDLNDMFGFTFDEHARAISGLLNKLSVFRRRSVIKISERNDFSLSDIDTKPTLLVIGDRQGNQQSTQLTSLIVSQLFNHVQRRMAGKVKRRIPMYFMLDEAPRLQDKIDLSEILAIARSANTGMCVVTQDITQFEEREAGKIFNNCNTMLILKGSSADSAQFFSKQLGNRKVENLQASRGRTLSDDFRDINQGRSFFGVLFRSLFSDDSQSVSVSDAPVLNTREIMNIPTGTYSAIAMVKNFGKPTLVDLDLSKRTY